MLHGWIILDKPVGLGSTQAVGAIKRLLREAGEPKTKVGHGGTLDPFATGVLPLFLAGPWQSNLQDFLNGANEMQVHAFQLFRSEVFIHVHAVLSGKENVFHARTLCGQEFFLHSADGQNIPAQRDLAGHAGLRTHRRIFQQRNQRGGHGHSG